MQDSGKIVQDISLATGQSITCLFNKVLKVEAQLVGFAEQDFLVLQFPYITGIRNQIIPNTSFAAHLRMSQSLIFFSSIVEHIYEKKKLVICTYPTSFKLFEARITQRFPCFVPISLSINDAYMLAVTQDISNNGCHLVVEAAYYKFARAIQLKDTLTVEFGSGNSSSFLVSAEVVYLKQGLASTHLGLHFTSIAGEDSITLKQLIQSHQHEINL
ncbi:MAG: PilZ domain-containing protein [Desulfovibrionaceae bacterium]